jgi:beta-phosphoglucomutase-like phosphatase (HAD superfamily)
VSSPSPPFAAIFDWDGVIIDSGQLHAELALARCRVGKPIADSFIRGFGMKSGELLRFMDGRRIPRKLPDSRVERGTLRKLVARGDIAALPGVAEWLSS